MKRKLTADEAVKTYIEVSLILTETVKTGDYKRGNKEGKRIIKIFKEFEKNMDLALEVLPRLFDNENVVVRTKAAADCIALNIFTKKSKAILEEIANNKSYGIFRFNAEMTLKVWREQGYIKIYSKQKVNPSNFDAE